MWSLGLLPKPIGDVAFCKLREPICALLATLVTVSTSSAVFYLEISFKVLGKSWGGGGGDV